MKLNNINKNNDWVLRTSVPQAPGTISIPQGHVRLYHYTRVNDAADETKHLAAELLRHNGLDIKKAKGSTYGEPNVVWASSGLPSKQKVFAEFSIAMDDPRWSIGKPPVGDSPRAYEERRWDCYFYDSILPTEIIAVHEPWHSRYRYIIENGLVDGVKAGEFDNLLDSAEYGPAVWKVRHETS